MSKQGAWTAICDEERECWIIVDREPGGSQSHDGDGADEHIADVFDPENAARIVNAAAEITRLRAIVDKLPKTADGVPIVPGMQVCFPADGVMQHCCICRGRGFVERKSPIMGDSESEYGVEHTEQHRCVPCDGNGWLTEFRKAIVISQGIYPKEESR